MTRGAPWGVGRCGIVVAVLIALTAACGGGDSGPSLILVTLDTTRADALGAYGGTRVATPNFDRIASEGVVCDAAVSPAPLTLPSHATVLTGRYPASHGARHNGIYRLPDREVTLAEALRDRGYRSAAFVAVYVLNREFGTGQGFDEFDDVPLRNVGGGPDAIYQAERSADEINAAVFEWLEDRPRGPFFLWVHYFDPHAPYEPPEVAGRVLEGVGYDREISYVDSCFGDLLDRLDKEGILDSSVLVVAGDHGESLGEHRERTHGLFLYESTQRVPLVLRAPGRLPAGVRLAHPVSLADVAPTVLDLLGAGALPDAQGISLLPTIEAPRSGADRRVFAETLMPRLEYGWAETFMVRDSRFKFIHSPRPELYDLENDPGETVDLTDREPERARDMAAAIEEWLERTERSGGGEASRPITAEEERRLRSLGYLGGDAFRSERQGGTGPRTDPKDGIVEMAPLLESMSRLARRDFQGALEFASGILRDNPRNAKARTVRVRALCELGRFEAAEEEARAGLALARSGDGARPVMVSQALGMLASTLRLQGATEEAESAYRAILEVDPRHDAAAVDLAAMLVEAGRPNEALDLLRPVFERSPNSRMALATRFAAEMAVPREDDALRTAVRIAGSQAADPATLRRAGELLLNQGRPAEAARCFAAARDALGFRVDLAGRLGEAQYASGMDEEARETFLEMAARLPGDPRPRYYLGKIALRTGDEAEARRRFDECLRLDPHFSLGLVSLAEWLHAEGRIDEARQALAEAVRRDSGNERARRILESVDERR